MKTRPSTYTVEYKGSLILDSDSLFVRLDPGARGRIRCSEFQTGAGWVEFRDGPRRIQFWLMADTLTVIGAN